MLIGVDQVLLDLVVEVDSDLGIFERYNIERNTQSLAEARHAELLAELVARADVEVDQEVVQGCPAAAAGSAVATSPGGTVANSLRAAAWWLRQLLPARHPALKMLGRVGRDAAAERLRRELEAAGVAPLFQVAPEPGSEPQQNGTGAMADHTGLCCCLIAEKERTMVTELGAGRALGQLVPALAAATASGAPGDAAELPRVVVISGFYVQADPEGAAAVRAWCEDPQAGSRTPPILALTVGAQWCCRLPAVQALARVADFVFANESEVIELGAAVASRPEASGTAFDAAILDIASWKQRGWMVGTRGPKSVAIASAGLQGAPVVIPVEPVEPAKFVDDVGAGDAFMGAFLVTVWQRLADLRAKEPKSGWSAGGAAACLSEADAEAAARAGIATAGAVVQCVGCQFPSANN